MLRLQVELLPQSSMAVQVREIPPTIAQVPGIVVSTNETATVASQASVAVAVAAPKLGTAGHSTVGATVGQVIAGGRLSVTAMLRLQVALFPQSSVAVQVRVTLYSCGQMPGVVLSEKVTGVLLSQASRAVASPKIGSNGHSTVGVTVGQVITGGRLSVMVTVLLQVEVLPQSSLAVQVRVSAYSCGQIPGVTISEMFMVGTASQASVAVAILKSGVSGHSTVAGMLGQVITGGRLSSTVMLCEQVLALLPQASLARHTRMATYSRQPVEGGGVVDTMLMVGVASQASAAVGSPNTGVAGHSIVVFAGQVIVGEVLSSTVMLCEQVLALLPQISLARQTRMAT
jgi:hypothetical protein